MRWFCCCHFSNFLDVVVKAEYRACEKESLRDIEDETVRDIVYTEKFNKDHRDGRKYKQNCASVTSNLHSSKEICRRCVLRRCPAGARSREYTSCEVMTVLHCSTTEHTCYCGSNV